MPTDQPRTATVRAVGLRGTGRECAHAFAS
jgi:hypothetical protein